MPAPSSDPARRGATLRASRGLVLACTVATLTACALGADVTALDPKGAKGALVVELPVDDGAPATVTALAVDDATALAMPPRSPLARARFVLFFECSLASLGLDAGAQALDLSESTGRPLPRSAHVATDGDGPWRTLDTWPPELDRLRIVDDRAPACTRFDVESQLVVGTKDDRSDILIPLAGEEVLVGTAVQRFLRASRAGITEFEGLPRDGVWLGGFVAPDGDTWVVGVGGRVVHGTPERGFVEGPRMNLEIACAWITTSPPGLPFEAFVLTCRREVERFDGAAWTVLPTTTATRAEFTSAIAWVGPGEALVLGPGEDQVGWVSAAGERVEVPVLAATEYPTAVEWSAALGPLLGTDRGVLFRAEGDAWLEVGRGASLRGVRGILPYADGVLWGGAGGLISQWHAGVGRCDDVVGIAGNLIRMVDVGGTWITLGISSNDDDALTYLTPGTTALPAACAE